MDIVFQKKQNSNRVKGVGVLSILAKVKMQKRVIFALTAFMGFNYRSVTKHTVQRTKLIDATFTCNLELFAFKF
jgi:hypothetical protein